MKNLFMMQNGKFLMRNGRFAVSPNCCCTPTPQPGCCGDILGAWPDDYPPTLNLNIIAACCDALNQTVSLRRTFYPGVGIWYDDSDIPTVVDCTGQTDMSVVFTLICDWWWNGAFFEYGWRILHRLTSVANKQTLWSCRPLHMTGTIDTGMCGEASSLLQSEITE